MIVHFNIRIKGVNPLGLYPPLTPCSQEKDCRTAEADVLFPNTWVMSRGAKAESIWKGRKQQLKSSTSSDESNTLKGQRLEYRHSGNMVLFASYGS